MLANIILFICLPTFTFQAFMKNKYVAEVETVQTCPNNDQMKSPIRNLKLSAYNRTFKTLSYDFEYHQPLDEKVGGGITADRWGDGGWITIPFIGFQSNICKYMLRFFKSVWVPMYKNAGAEHPDRCPIPAGNYSVKNYQVDKVNINAPFFNGRFRFTSTFQDVDTKEDILCIIYVIRITEVF